MASILRYHPIMKRLKFAAPVVVAFAVLVPGLAAQNAMRAPSMRVGAPVQNFHHFSGPTFVPSFGNNHFRTPTPCCGTFSGSFTYGIGTPANPFYPPTFGWRHHGFNNGFAGYGGYLVPYAVPVYPYPYYGYDSGYPDSQYDQQQQLTDDAQQDPPAPTIFEHRARRAAPPAQPASDLYDMAAPAQDSGTAIASDVAAPQAAAAEPSSVLIFRDGHQLEVQNYAIVGDTLYDLTPGHPRKIALASIDIPATVQANDDRGIIFRVPVQN